MLNFILGFVAGFFFMLFLSLAAASKDFLGKSGLEYRDHRTEEWLNKPRNDSLVGKHLLDNPPYRCPQGSTCEFFNKEDEACLYGKI